MPLQSNNNNSPFRYDGFIIYKHTFYDNQRRWKTLHNKESGKLNNEEIKQEILEIKKLILLELGEKEIEN